MPELVSAQDKEHIVKLVHSIFPSLEIWAFGSRIRGDARPYSDLDLCLRGLSPLSLQLMSQLEEAFAHTDLPYKVDVTDFHQMDKSFQSIVLSTGVRWS